MVRGRVGSPEGSLYQARRRQHTNLRTDSKLLVANCPPGLAKVLEDSFFYRSSTTSRIRSTLTVRAARRVYLDSPGRAESCAMIETGAATTTIGLDVAEVLTLFDAG